MFAYNLRTLEFVFDPSLDCFVEGGKFMTIDSECKLHKDPKKCEMHIVVRWMVWQVVG